MFVHQEIEVAAGVDSEGSKGNRPQHGVRHPCPGLTSGGRRLSGPPWLLQGASHVMQSRLVFGDSGGSAPATPPTGALAPRSVVDVRLTSSAALAHSVRSLTAYSFRRGSVFGTLGHPPIARSLQPKRRRGAADAELLAQELGGVAGRQERFCHGVNSDTVDQQPSPSKPQEPPPGKQAQKGDRRDRREFCPFCPYDRPSARLIVLGETPKLPLPAA